MPELILIRHGDVEPKWKPICYGTMEVPLSDQGIATSQALAIRIAAMKCPAMIYHSGLLRTRTLAEMIQRQLPEPVAVIEDVRLREREYGDWQGLTWDEIFASDPEHFHDLVEQPDTYRPPSELRRAETTTEMQQRIVAWYASLPNNYDSKPIIAISHSGPIAALAGHILGQHSRDWGPWMLETLGALRINYKGGIEIVW